MSKTLTCFSNNTRYLDTVGTQKRRNFHAYLTAHAHEKIKQLRLSVDFSSMHLDKIFNECYRKITKTNVKSKEDELVSRDFWTLYLLNTETTIMVEEKDV